MVQFEPVRQMIMKLVEHSEPDLITITGDFSYGNEVSVYGMFSFINNLGIPWAPVFGNHDFSESSISIEQQSKLLENFSNCLFKTGPEDLGKIGNYVVNIYEKKNGSVNIVKSLIMMDSGESGINDLQTAWYQYCVESVDCSTAVFLHIPVDGFKKAEKAAYKVSPYRVSLEESYSGSLSIWNTGYEDSFGVNHEGVNCRDSAAMYDLVQRLGSTDLMVAGHDHNNCSCIRYNGVTYVFGLKTGPGCYYEEGMSGGTVITVDSFGSFTVRHLFEKDLQTLPNGNL